MTLKTAGIVNANAKYNKGSARKEARTLERILHSCNSRVDITRSIAQVKKNCGEFIKEGVDIVMLSTGDGGVQTFLDFYFKQLYREFCNGMTPIEFAHNLNPMILDSNSAIPLPAIYHKRKGTLNVYADTLGMKGNAEKISENIHMANHKYDGLGIKAFRRVYVPVLMIYSKEKPDDLETMRLMTLYCDGILYNFFQEYYAPREEGRDVNMARALEVIIRASTSSILDFFMPRNTTLGKGLYTERYIDKINREIEGEVKVTVVDEDGSTEEKTVISKNGKRNITAVGTTCASLYGIKPFHAMPNKPEEFKSYFGPLVQEEPQNLNIEDHTLQILTGNCKPVDLSRAVPPSYFRLPLNVAGMLNTKAKRVEIEQTESLNYIADGSTESNGKSVVIEIAYLQPFILLDHPPMT